MALRTASIMVMRAILIPRFLPLAADMRRHLGIDALENIAHRRLAACMQRSVFLGALLRIDHLVQDLGLGLNVTLLGPDALEDQVLLQPQHGISKRPCVGLSLWSIGTRIVGGRVGADP